MLDASASCTTQGREKVLKHSVFAFLQTLSGRAFTLDGCASNNGDDALCPLYCTPDNFQQYDKRGHHTWLNPPYCNASALLQSYVQAKQLDPHNTSACIMLPKWRNPPWTADVAHMQAMHTFGVGQTLYMHPAHERADMHTNRWPVVVYHDPVEPITESNTDSVNTVAPFDMNQHVTSSRILLDSGA